MVTSPRPAVSVYLESCRVHHDATTACPTLGNGNSNSEAGRGYLLTCIGMHFHQLPLEYQYNSTMKDIYCLWLFVKRMKCMRRGDVEDEQLVEIVAPWEEKMEELLAE